MRITQHPILGEDKRTENITINVDGLTIKAIPGEPIAAALLAAGIKKFRVTAKYQEPRGFFCGIGRCTDCLMTVNGRPNVRTCITPVEEGMIVSTQKGLGTWEG